MGKTIRSILFLDIDGVLNTSKQRTRFGIDFICQNRVKLLGSVVRRSKCSIILSSEWRVKPEDLKLVVQALSIEGLKLAGALHFPIGRKASRAELVKEFLCSVEFDNFVIVDDQIHSFVGDPFFDGTIVMTNDSIGLDESCADQILHGLLRLQ